jgi:hypothetical protein
MDEKLLEPKGMVFPTDLIRSQVAGSDSPNPSAVESRERNHSSKELYLCQDLGKDQRPTRTTGNPET